MTDASRRGTVLIVDDAPENIHVLLEALKADHAVLAATSGEKALALLARGTVPDLILLDVVMPGMDGYEVCRRIKADSATQDIPVIFVTSLGDAADEEFGLSLGAIDYITKPVNPALVRARVKNHLALAQAARLKEDVERIVRHDVKTPLTSILSVPELLLLADNLDEHQREMLKRVQDAAYTVLSMINLSVDLFKMERGLYHVRAEPVDLVPVVRRILAAQEDALETRGLAVQVSGGGTGGRAAGPVPGPGRGAAVLLPAGQPDRQRPGGLPPGRGHRRGPVRGKPGPGDHPQPGRGARGDPGAVLREIRHGGQEPGHGTRHLLLPAHRPQPGRGGGLHHLRGGGHHPHRDPALPRAGHRLTPKISRSLR